MCPCPSRTCPSQISGARALHTNCCGFEVIVASRKLCLLASPRADRSRASVCVWVLTSVKSNGDPRQRVLKTELDAMLIRINSRGASVVRRLRTSALCATSAVFTQTDNSMEATFPSVRANQNIDLLFATKRYEKFEVLKSSNRRDYRKTSSRENGSNQWFRICLKIQNFKKSDDLEIRPNATALKIIDFEII